MTNSFQTPSFETNVYIQYIGSIPNPCYLFLYKDRVSETTTTTGTGDITLLGARTGFITFYQAMGSSLTNYRFYYTITKGSSWETGIGYLSSSTTLVRETVLSSSNSNELVDWTLGTKNIILDASANFLEKYETNCEPILTAGENIYKNDPVYISESDGNAYRLYAEYTPTTTRALHFAGFANNDVSAGCSFSVINVGVASGFAGLRTGGFYYARPQSDLTTIRYGSSQNKGYFTGGYSVANSVTTTDIITFSTEAVAAQTSADLSTATRAMAGVSECKVKGYFLGGYSSNYSDKSYKVIFSTDTSLAKTSANLSQIRAYSGGVTEGTTKGYICGGNSGSDVNTVDVLNFSNDSTSAATSLSASKSGLAGISEGSTKGYIAGGSTNVVEKITFSNNTIATIAGTLSQSRSYLCGVSQGSSKGYFCGGFNVATTDQVTFSSDAVAAATSANLSQARGYSGSCSNGNDAGYIAGGVSSSINIVDKIDKLTFSTDSTAASTSVLSTVRAEVSSVGTDAGGMIRLSQNESANKYVLGVAISPTKLNILTSGKFERGYTYGERGYFSGGFTNATETVSSTRTDKILFSSDTTSSQTTANLTLAKGRFASLSDGYSRGYCIGGSTVGTDFLSSSDKITFNTDTTSASSSSAISTANMGIHGLSYAKVKGYLAGGYTTDTPARVYVATGYTINFAIETTSSSTSTNLSVARDQCATVSNIVTHGYFGGGRSSSAPTSVTTTDKITFYNDTTFVVSTAALSQARTTAGGLSDGISKGVFTGGYSDALAANVVTADKIYFATDVTSAQTTMDLGTAKRASGCVSQGDVKGYSAGGNSGVVGATTIRFLFYIETNSLVAASALSQGRQNLGGISDTGL